MAKVSPLIFRQYDIRGIYPDQLNEEVAFDIGRAYGTRCRRHGIHQVVLGRDNRLSSPPLATAVKEGLMATGLMVWDIGEVATPILYFACRHWHCDGGVMITASHNPPRYNGVKLVWGKGALFGPQIRELYEAIERGDLDQGKGQVEERDAWSEYRSWIVERIRLGSRPITAVLDCGNGTASAFAPELLKAIGCSLVELYCESDPTFPHHLPDPSKAENLKDLQAKVLEVSADVGLAVDGDGDRLAAIDEKGNILWGDQLMILFSREVLSRHPGAKVIVDVKSSQAVLDEIKKAGGQPILYRTGHSFIKAKMMEESALLAGEMSGHLFFADEYFGYDDALYAACRLVRLLSHQTVPLSALLQSAPQYLSTPEVRVECDDHIKFQVVQTVVDRLKEIGYHVVDVDGARIMDETGWALIRASNTEPVLVLRAEGQDLDSLKRMKEVITRVLAPFSEVNLEPWNRVEPVS
ncbi:MAG: phosphomannomutase/phosphoglucomutase [Armatimonadetes bacterium]|nr:phosphomannomutase/phosphoglucomutase [Armatimonadota bacterium]MDW8122552.1 phosphomannomutase/phosphoglucomutase [Armatimonadota bacterium]